MTARSSGSLPYRYTTITCNGCGAYVHSIGRTNIERRLLGLHHGWINPKRGVDYCPKCKENPLIRAIIRTVYTKEVER